MRIRFLGTGTPIGQDGLHQACILVETREHRLLLDCGMTALASLGRIGLDQTDIDAVIVSHLHGDHFGGLAPLLLDATQRGRSRPLTIAGPTATRQRVGQALELFSWTSVRLDAATFVVLTPGETQEIAGCEVTAVEVVHNPATAPTGLRVRTDGRTIGYSGDAGWSESLADVARGAPHDLACGLVQPDEAAVEREDVVIASRDVHHPVDDQRIGSGGSQGGDGVDLDERLGVDEARDCDQCAGGVGRREVAQADFVNSFEVRHIAHEHCHLDDVVKRAAKLLEALADVPQAPFGLSADISGADQAIVGICGQLTRDPHQPADLREVEAERVAEGDRYVHGVVRAAGSERDALHGAS